MDLKFTTTTQEALQTAIQLAASAGNPEVQPVHVGLALLTQSDSYAVNLLSALNVDLTQLRTRLEKIADALPSVSGSSTVEPQVSRALGALLSTARSEEHTSELQSRGHLVCRLLREKKNKDRR